MTLLHLSDYAATPDQLIDIEVAMDAIHDELTQGRKHSRACKHTKMGWDCRALAVAAVLHIADNRQRMAAKERAKSEARREAVWEKLS